MADARSPRFSVLISPSTINTTDKRPCRRALRTASRAGAPSPLASPWHLRPLVSPRAGAAAAECALCLHGAKEIDHVGQEC